MVADDNGDVEGSFSASQLFSFSFSFVTRQICIRRGSRMRDNNNARGMVHKFVYGDIYFVALLKSS